MEVQTAGLGKKWLPSLEEVATITTTLNRLKISSQRWKTLILPSIPYVESCGELSFILILGRLKLCCRCHFALEEDREAESN